jgi:hypothetical protein
MLQAFTKLTEVVTLYMPLWTWSELQLCRDLIFVS